MKKLLLLIVLGSLVTGCRYAGNIGAGVVGSGVRKSEKRDLGPFTSISTDGAFDIEVICQKPQTFEIEGDDNLLPLVSTEVTNGVLRIRNLRGYSTGAPINIRISVADIDSLKTDGAGTIEISGVKNDKFGIDSNGAPSIRVSGETEVLEIDTNGAGKIDTHKLRASKAVVESNGVSKVELFASDELSVKVSGPSQVIYDGDPHVNKTVNGPGSVEQRDSGGA